MKKNRFKKTMIILTPWLILGGVLVSSATVFAADTYTLLESLPEVGSDAPTVGQYLGGMFKLGLGIATVLAVLMITYGGFKYITAEAYTAKREGKDTVQDAILGLILALASWLLLHTINPDFTNSSFNLTAVPGPVKTESAPPPSILQARCVYTNGSEWKATIVSGQTSHECRNACLEICASNSSYTDCQISQYIK